MTKKRKQQLDRLWMDTEVGKWAIALADGRKDEADKICTDLFKKGHVAPVEYILDEEKKLSMILKEELQYKKEGREYMDALEKENYSLVDIMVAYEFSILDLYDL